MEKIGSLKVQTQLIDDHTAIVMLTGEMDLYTTSRAKTIISELIDTGCRHLIVDLHQAEYLDSTALGMLIGALRRAREQGGGLRLVAPRLHVRRLLEITRLTFAFPIDASTEAAQARFLEDEAQAA